MGISRKEVKEDEEEEAERGGGGERGIRKRKRRRRRTLHTSSIAPSLLHFGNANQRDKVAI